MLNRCNATSTKDAEHYTGRGITVCDSWLQSIENFICDMGPCPEGYELERLDYTKGYSPENCVWADEYTQAWNKGSYKNNKSGKTGVHFDSHVGKWRAVLWYKGKKYDGANFYTQEEAIAKRKQLELEVIGHEKEH
jgi:hypothetical protein